MEPEAGEGNGAEESDSMPAPPACKWQFCHQETCAKPQTSEPVYRLSNHKKQPQVVFSSIIRLAFPHSTITFK